MIHLPIIIILCFLSANPSESRDISNNHPAFHIHRSLNEDFITCTVHEIEALAKPGGYQHSLQEIHKYSCSDHNFGPTILLQGDIVRIFSSLQQERSHNDDDIDDGADTNNMELISGVTSLTIPTSLVSEHLTVDLDDPMSSKLIKVFNMDSVEIDIRNKLGSRSLRGSQQKEERQNMEITPDLHENTLLEENPIGTNLSIDVNHNRSLLAKYSGIYRTLVVRVSDNRGHEPTYSAQKISRHIFSGEHNMSKGFRACSNNKLKLLQAEGGDDVVNGVVDVVVDIDLSTVFTSVECVTAADNVLASSYDIGNQHDYVMYICPDVVDFNGAVAGANINGYKSWYSDVFGSYPYVQMHEIGHNLFFFHSGEGDDEYADPTGIMGGLYEAQLNWGKMCFNAAKTYNAGWYSNHHENIQPTISTKGYKGTLVDVNTASSHVTSSSNLKIQPDDDVVVRIYDDNEHDMFFMLHRLEGMTRDMVPGMISTHANRVNIVNQTSTGVPSTLLDQLGSGEEYVKEDWAGTGKALHVKVCSIAETSNDGGAKVIVYLEGQNSASCEDNNGEDNNDNSNFPTSSPSCVDSSLKMYNFNESKKSCDWVANNKTQQRCEKKGVASHCPVTCGTCILCEDSSKRFVLKENGEVKSCSWVRNKNTAQRCSKEGVADTCRKTCGTCSSMR